MDGSVGTWKNEKRPKDAHRTKKTTIKHTYEIVTRRSRRQRKQNKDREAIPSAKPNNVQQNEDTRQLWKEKRSNAVCVQSGKEASTHGS